MIQLLVIISSVLTIGMFAIMLKNHSKRSIAAKEEKIVRHMEEWAKNNPEPEQYVKEVEKGEDGTVLETGKMHHNPEHTKWVERAALETSKIAKQVYKS